MQNYVIVIVTFIPTEPQLNILFTLILHSVMHIQPIHTYMLESIKKYMEAANKIGKL